MFTQKTFQINSDQYIIPYYILLSSHIIYRFKGAQGAPCYIELLDRSLRSPHYIIRSLDARGRATNPDHTPI